MNVFSTRLLALEQWFTPNILVLANSPADTAYGGRADSWSEALSIRGMLRQLDIKELPVNMSLRVKATHKLICRTAAVTHTNRISYQGSVYQVSGIKPFGGYYMAIDLEWLADEQWV